jgi:hypothetical protein
MTMDSILWVLMPVLVAAGTAIFAYYIMQSRMEVAVARERETIAKVQAQLRMQEEALPDKIKAAEESAHRRAFEQFLLDFRVEERQYIRESRSRFLTRKSMIMQERLFFRNIPLSNWVEHELPITEGSALEAAEKNSVFSARALADYSKSTPRLLTS